MVRNNQQSYIVLGSPSHNTSKSVGHRRQEALNYVEFASPFQGSWIRVENNVFAPIEQLLHDQKQCTGRGGPLCFPARRTTRSRPLTEWV